MTKPIGLLAPGSAKEYERSKNLPKRSGSKYKKLKNQKAKNG